MTKWLGRWSFLVGLTMLGITWGFLQSFSRAEIVPVKKVLTDMPLSMNGRWEGRELSLEEDVLKILRLTEYVLRVYVPVSAGAGGESGSNGSLGPVSLYVGYYQSQRTGATYHSPKNCLPGAGWQFVESVETPVQVSDGETIRINRAIIQKGLERQMIIYWYQDRGRVIANEYWAKAYLIWDAMTKNRTDGSLVRLSIPISQTPDAAFAEGVSFIRAWYPTLQAFLPGPDVSM